MLSTGNAPDFLSVRFNADRILIQRPGSMESEEWEKIGGEVVGLIASYLSKFMDELPASDEPA